MLQNQRTGVGGLQFLGTGYGAFHTVNTRSQHQFRTESFQEVAALQTHCVGHCQYQLVTFGGGYKSQPYARIATGRFDEGGTGLQQPFCLGIFYHGKRHAVLHTAGRVKIFQFGNNTGFQTLILVIIIQLQQGSVAYQVGKAFCYLLHNPTVFKFLIPLREKTNNPEWNEVCYFLQDKSSAKLVRRKYHKYGKYVL